MTTEQLLAIATEEIEALRLQLMDAKAEISRLETEAARLEIEAESWHIVADEANNHYLALLHKLDPTA